MSEATISTLKLEITSDTKSADNSLNSLINRLEKLEKICNGTSNSQEKVNKVTSKYADRLTAVNKVLNRASSFMKSFTTKCGEWFNESNEYVEALNLFEVTMGKGAEQAKRYAEELQNLMGIDIQEWMNYQGSFNQLLEGYGLDSKISNEMSQQLTQIAYDLSSLWNVDVDTAFKKVQSGMSGQIKGLKVWGINLSVAQLKETALAHGIELSTSKMTEAQKAILRYITLMEKTTNVQGDLARTIVTPSNAMRILSAQTTQAKRALGNIVSVLVVKFIPVMQVVVTYLRDTANWIANLMGYELPEIDYTGLDFASSYADDLDDSLSDATDSAKKLKKTLLGFDEINILNSPTDSTSVLGGGLPADLGLWDYAQSLGYDFTQDLEGIDTSDIEETLQHLGEIVGGALFAIGAFILFSGLNIPFGLSLMIAGAAVAIVSAKEDWDSGTNKFQTIMNIISGIVGGALLAIGVYLAFTGNVGLGIGLITAGAVTLISAVTLNSDLSQNMKNQITMLSIIVSSAMFVIGVVLAFSGQIPLGIGFMIAGASTMVTSIAVNWNELPDNIKGILSGIAFVAGTSLLAIGIILAFTGNVPLGVALIAVGAVGLVASVSINWDKIPNKMRSILSTITAVVGGAMLALGAILTFCASFSTPLGIALMIAGAVSLATSVVLNWNTTKDKVVNIVQLLTTILGTASLVIGALLIFTGAGVPLGIGLMLVGAASLAASIALNWDSAKNKINTVLSSILSIISGAAIAIGVLLCLSGAGLGLGIGLIMLGLKGVQKAEKIDSNPVTKWIKSICNGAIDLVEKAVNKCIRLINDFSFDWDVPDWLQSALGFKTLKVGFSLSEVSIPRLATGAVNIPNGQIFQARERGPELVGTIGNKSAVVNNDQIVASVEGGVYRGMRSALAESNNSTKSDNSTLVVMIDGEVVHKGFVKWHNDKVKINGRSPLNV